MKPKGTAQELQQRRERAVLLLDENHGIRQAARMVGVAPGSVVRWRDAYEKKGLKALASKPHPGRTYFQTLATKLHWGRSPHHGGETV